ncbi:MAG: SPASM domain-containing protein [Betaproteobacteria bacterium]|nr:SPASM domain-containing protein [Betaproteobacteria bacterium]
MKAIIQKIANSFGYAVHRKETIAALVNNLHDLEQKVRDRDDSIALITSQNVSQLNRDADKTNMVPATISSPDARRWDCLSFSHLIEQVDPRVAADLFKRSVKMVEIEVFSYCNRRCWFCPNATIDRISSNNFMPSQMYTSILEQLASIDYDGMLTYSRYNEPLADKIILDRIAEARDTIPKIILHTNTNGDYLNNDYLKQLYDAGLRSLGIQIYLKNNERYDHAKIKTAGEKTLKRVGLPATVICDVPGERYEQQLHYRDMHIRMYGRNFETGGTNRGGQVPIHMGHRRTSPCLVPFWAMYIDYDGSAVPCCNFRSDVPAHKDYVLGNLQSEPNIFAMYAGQAAASFRRSLIGDELKSGLCSNCHYAEEQPTSVQTAQLAQLLRWQREIP